MKIEFNRVLKMFMQLVIVPVLLNHDLLIVSCTCFKIWTKTVTEQLRNYYYCYLISFRLTLFFDLNFIYSWIFLNFENWLSAINMSILN